jgi:hypothetical protein
MFSLGSLAKKVNKLASRKLTFLEENLLNEFLAN